MDVLPYIYIYMDVLVDVLVNRWIDWRIAGGLGREVVVLVDS